MRVSSLLRRSILIGCFFWLLAGAHSELPRLLHRAIEHPAPPPSIESRPVVAIPARPTPAAGVALYSIGEPSDLEQEFLELLNRARLDPVGEGIRLRDTTDPDVRAAYYQEYQDGTVRWVVDTNRFAADMALIPPVPPLAFNSKLIIAARKHSWWMFENAIQVHDESGLTPSQRVANAGYPWLMVAENIYAYAKSTFHGHVGFEVDWGEGPFGMQDPPYHRINNHNAALREVGIGIVMGSNTTEESGLLNTVGPQVVTVDFAAPQSPSPLATGVAFVDLNGNQQYDVGEGLGGVTVEVSGSPYYAVTSESGGYSIPTEDGNHSLTFTANHLAPVLKPVTVTGGNNVKIDLVLGYTAPTLTGPSSAFVGAENVYTATPIPGATSYQLRTVKRYPLSIVEGAESGTSGLTIQASEGYQVITSEVPAVDGSQVFHLAHPGSQSANPQDQFITLAPSFRATSTSQWAFASMLGIASESQTARAQVSTNGGISWVDIWSQSGVEGKGETNFVKRSVSLSHLAGLEFKARVAYTVGFGSYFPQTEKGVGVYFDAIALKGVERLEELGVSDAPASGLITFNPPTSGEYGLSARPILGQRVLAYGGITTVTALVGQFPKVIKLMPPVAGPSGKLRIDFTVDSGVATIAVLEKLDAMVGIWTRVNGAQVTSNSATDYSIRFLPVGGQGFLRVRLP